MLRLTYSLFGPLFPLEVGQSVWFHADALVGGESGGRPDRARLRPVGHLLLLGAVGQRDEISTVRTHHHLLLRLLLVGGHPSLISDHVYGPNTVVLLLSLGRLTVERRRSPRLVDHITGSLLCALDWPHR